MSRKSLQNVTRLIDLANKELPDNQSFLEDFKRSIELTDEKSRGLPSQTFKPSSLNCKRGCYYQIIGAQPDEGHSSFNMIGICNSGTDIHVRVQTAVMQMKDNGIDCEWIDVETFIKERGLDYLIVREKKGTETKNGAASGILPDPGGSSAEERRRRRAEAAAASFYFSEVHRRVMSPSSEREVRAGTRKL
jgi:hypothetical protein